MSKKIFTLQPLRKILKRAGAKRVSDDAARELGKYLEEKAMLLSTEAEKIARHSGRKTVMKRDVKLARKVLGR